MWSRTALSTFPRSYRGCARAATCSRRNFPVDRCRTTPRCRSRAVTFIEEAFQQPTLPSRLAIRTRHIRPPDRPGRRKLAPNSRPAVVYGKNLQPWVNTTLFRGELHLLPLPYIV